MQDLILALGGMLLRIAIIGGVIVIFWAILSVVRVRNVPRNIRIRRRLAELVTSGFVPSERLVASGAGIAVDPIHKRVFLANSQGMKVYELADIVTIETKVYRTRPFPSAVIRITVRDVTNPLFEIRAGVSEITIIKEIIECASCSARNAPACT